MGSLKRTIRAIAGPESVNHGASSSLQGLNETDIQPISDQVETLLDAVSIYGPILRPPGHLIDTPPANEWRFQVGCFGLDSSRIYSRPIELSGLDLWFGSIGGLRFSSRSPAL